MNKNLRNILVGGAIGVIPVLLIPDSTLILDILIGAFGGWVGGKISNSIWASIIFAGIFTFLGVPLLVVGRTFIFGCYGWC